ncbi:MAG: NAD(P)/FAD-dependent oxidoreductase [Pirellulaceae bacterium]|jgi:flavin-dependent dehydrogenase|nr:alkylhalidase [Planctomycetaceae bacterium]MDP6466638.1 NAD(P)/FAD-dependent oxidoreductase [Pirellulaceae bacterium]MDP6555719.1 NAD(P)/FAD-dependent oxidoreductase [Pirellulaceae bacterium]MDP6720712.1 NAD(P)/FAD-dependent oxidoreductase [Pirellulaceae bacterium]
MKDQYDCIVVGGGPAGGCSAALIAEAGFSTLLVEREKIPRFHVGESLMPEAYWTFERLGVLDKMRQSDFVKKVSVQFVSSTGAESQPFFFREHDPRESAQTWQVTRADFDKMLFDNAAEKSAECHDQTHVMDIVREKRRVVGVTLRTAAGELREVRSQVLVDATGQQAFLANRLGLRIDTPEPGKVAIWGYYRGARRDAGEDGGATIVLHTRDKLSWFWFIPLANDVTSIGVVGDRDYLFQGRGEPSDIFEDELVKCPALVERLMDAELTSEFRRAKEFSYSTKQNAGDGWIMVGDARGFIDPIYSSGVYFALRSGELAADAIVTGLRDGDTTASQLSGWYEDFSAGTRRIQKLVDAYYNNDFNFGQFLRDYPQHTGNLTDLLVGRIFHDRAGCMFDDMVAELAKATVAAAQKRRMAAKRANAEN